MRTLVAGALILSGAMLFAQQQSSPLPPGTTPPTFPQDKTPDKDVGRGMPPDTRAKEPSAIDVQKQIQEKLDSEPGLTGNKLQVKVSTTQVILRGTVSDEQQHQAARRIAESYAGTRKIVDRLEVKP